MQPTGATHWCNPLEEAASHTRGCQMLLGASPSLGQPHQPISRLGGTSLAMRAALDMGEHQGPARSRHSVAPLPTEVRVALPSSRHETIACVRGTLSFHLSSR